MGYTRNQRNRPSSQNRQYKSNQSRSPSPSSSQNRQYKSNQSRSPSPIRVAKKDTDTSTLALFLPAAVMMYLATSHSHDKNKSYSNDDKSIQNNKSVSLNTDDPCYLPYTEMMKCIENVEDGKESECRNFFTSFTKCTELNMKTDV